VVVGTAQAIGNATSGSPIRFVTIEGGNVAATLMARGDVSASRRGYEYDRAYFCEGDANCTAEERGQVSRLTLLANAYVDLGEHWAVTPYVGAGVGMAYVDWEKWRTNESCLGGGQGCRRRPREVRAGLRYTFSTGL
jgi:opacity protein-like surface antigen